VGDVIRGLYARVGHLVHELARFGVVGGVAFLVDLGLFNVLHFVADWNSLLARTASTGVAATVAYFGNRHWSFKHRAYTGVRREYAVFIVITVVGLLIQLAVLAFVQYVLDVRGVLALNLLGFVGGTGVATVFRYVAYKRWVFLSHDRAAARAISSPAPVDPGPLDPAPASSEPGDGPVRARASTRAADEPAA
jgi:putative flippase GtrA